ncbi:Crp/Fnr family transcriptional regulator [Waterburya agarophytonicola K14]|uniref:Crp/Fnr family transcriptional regulator n=1 Tax=Waterburya agarophytonicola KI4 TaxID=2874699 RepID=A0A964FHY4_9CYAN|nr:Crp/Fnr family transcriptional regulator [Waterburya agarophytonicola]MCC0179442.1 Crp/Fnr family transcriptional regulator [Waterburya agarophytonicola KI4]
MRKSISKSENHNLIESLTANNFLFQDLDRSLLAKYLTSEQLIAEKLYSSRPVYTAFGNDTSLEYLYAIVKGGPVVVRSTPLDRIIDITYANSCFGMRNLALSFGNVSRTFPSLVEAYKTADVIKISLEAVKAVHQECEIFRQRYGLMFELQEKFQYHLLNCSTYPPQAVAALLRALVYQERELGNQPQTDGIFLFDLPIEIIAKACQLNHRTVEQVLKGMMKVNILKPQKGSHNDLVYVINPEELKAVYGATRDKVSWWPLK